MFVDASALVAILKAEPDSGVLADKLEASTKSVTSPVAVLETVISLTRQKKLVVEEVLEMVADMLRRLAIDVETIDSRTGELAVLAYSAYGKGSGHPAQLNMGDCFAYAMAKQHQMPLLYKGDDFARTDLA